MKSLLLVALSLAGCTNVTRWRQNALAPQPVGGVPLPRKTAAADPAAADKAQPFDIDEKTGRPKPNVILRLDHFPPAAPGQPQLPACYPAFPPDFDLGFALCADKPETRVAIAARNVEQDCYTEPKVARTLAALPIVVAGCKRGLLFVHNFDPTLHVDVEVRDVN